MEHQSNGYIQKQAGTVVTDSMENQRAEHSELALIYPMSTANVFSVMCLYDNATDTLQLYPIQSAVVV